MRGPIRLLSKQHRNPEHNTILSIIVSHITTHRGVTTKIGDIHCRRRPRCMTVDRTDRIKNRTQRSFISWLKVSSEVLLRECIVRGTVLSVYLLFCLKWGEELCRIDRTRRSVRRATMIESDQKEYHWARMIVFFTSSHRNDYLYDLESIHIRRTLPWPKKWATTNTSARRAIAPIIGNACL